MKRIACSAVALLIFTLLFGCTHTLNPTPEPIAWSANSKISLKAGVYYSPQFAGQEYSRKIGLDTWTVPIGSSSILLYDEMLPNVFEKTSRISKLSWDELAQQGMNVVVTPSLEHFDFRTGMDFVDDERYSVSYRTTLYSNRGVPVASWVVFGNAKSKVMWTISGAIEDDMNDARLKLLQGFERNAGPALNAIAKNHGDQIIQLEKGSVVLTAKRAELPGLEPKHVSELSEQGVIILQITAQSEIERELVIRASDMKVLMKEGQIIDPLSLSFVLSKLEKGSYTGFWLGGVIGTIIEERLKQSDRELQTKSGGVMLFGDRILSKGKKESGLVMFQLPKGIEIKQIEKVVAWLVDPIRAQGAQVDIELLVAP